MYGRHFQILIVILLICNCNNGADAWQSDLRPRTMMYDGAKSLVWFVHQSTSTASNRKTMRQ